MKKLLQKELRLSASSLSYFFLVATLLTFVPGYPLLVGTFFVTLGLFYSFQKTRENNDVTYSLLLPIAKGDIVKGKFLFAVFIEGCAFLLTSIFTLCRMLFLSNAAVYTSNALMGANFTFLGFALLIFGLFNLVFIGGFFKTAYYFGKPFIVYIVLALFTVTVAEALHYFPHTGALYALGFEMFWVQGVAFLLGIIAFFALTVWGLKKSVRAFEKIDL